MKDYAGLLKQGTAGLEKAGVEDFELNARELLGKALGINCRSRDFDAALSRQIDPQVQREFENLCKRRTEGEPLQYLVGEWEFYGLTFKVGEGVLIPRQDTETVVDTVLKKAPKDRKLTVADLCTGSGCIAMALEKHLDCRQLIGVELSDKALGFLQHNIKLNDSKMQVLKGDVTLKQTAQQLPVCDVITANPPYLTRRDMENLQKEVTFEPRSALYGGDDGLDFYRHIVINFKDRIKPGGFFAFEIGAGMEEDVMTILVRHGFENVRASRDACGIFRCVTGYKK